MAFESPAWANSGGTATYTAEQTRRAVFSAFARTSANTPGIISGGLLSTADLQLTAPGSGLSVNVGTGECIVGGSEGGVQGGYYAYNAATVNLSISAANPSNPRIDTVAVTISDGSYTEPTGGSGNQVAAQVVTGTPTAGATLTNLNGKAALPLSSLLLGYVLVPAGASNIISGDIANKAIVVTPQFFGTSGLGDGQPIVYNGTTGQWRALAANAGNATFLQLPAAQTLSLTWGIFTTGAGTINQAGSGDWTLSGLSTGAATINFPTRAHTPVVLATMDGAGATIGFAEVQTLGTSSSQIATYTSPSTLSNQIVSFAVIG